VSALERGLRSIFHGWDFVESYSLPDDSMVGVRLLCSRKKLEAAGTPQKIISMIAPRKASQPKSALHGFRFLPARNRTRL
jgi:hypothetical protein